MTGLRGTRNVNGFYMNYYTLPQSSQNGFKITFIMGRANSDADFPVVFSWNGEELLRYGTTSSSSNIELWYTAEWHI